MGEKKLNIAQINVNSKWECCKCGWIGKHSESADKTIVTNDMYLLVCPKCENKDEFFAYPPQKIPVWLGEFDGRNETLVMWDRTREVEYNGKELEMNSYSCSTCKSDYTFEERLHKYCPFCGGEYKFQTDVSI